MNTPLIIATASVAGTIAAIFAPLAARSHEAHSGMKYDAYCCQGDSQTGDCQAIPSSAVRVMSDGYQITIEPGQHRLVTKRHVFKVAFGAVRQSTDNEFHLCLYPSEDTFRCFYAPPMSF